ncbi:MAG: hypothetical protein EBR28_04885 [Planctomycetia bacterium]|nr:hypothetical protein [Planctomycetia bacterium]
MAEEKTRIVPRPAAKAGGRTLTFQCPNGHRINVDARLAGKRGTCSKCGVPVVIPTSDQTARSDSGPPMVPPDLAVVAEAAAVGPTPAPDAFANLFEGAAAAESRPAGELIVDVTGGAVEQGGSGIGELVQGHAPEGFAAPDQVDVVEHPTAQLVARLWLERNHGGIVELHVAGGGVILPEYYEPAWSRGTHALFASQTPDGKVTLTAVAWDTIQKIVVRQVDGMPDGMFPND